MRPLYFGWRPPPWSSCPEAAGSKPDWAILWPRPELPLATTRTTQAKAGLGPHPSWSAAEQPSYVTEVLTGDMREGQGGCLDHQPHGPQAASLPQPLPSISQPESLSANQVCPGPMQESLTRSLMTRLPARPSPACRPNRRQCFAQLALGSDYDEDK